MFNQLIMQPANNVQLTLALKSTVTAKIQQANTIQLKVAAVRDGR